jgi:hypothetical protein
MTIKIKLTIYNFSFFIAIHNAFVFVDSKSSYIGNYSELDTCSYEPFSPQGRAMAQAVSRRPLIA